MTGRRRALIAGAALAVVAGGGWAYAALRAVEPPLPTVAVTRGTFTDIVEIRGEVRPVRTTTVSAPANSGELLIVKIEKNGATVEAGDVVAEFDAVTMRRTIQDKQSELRTALAELQQAKSQTTITLEERNRAVRRAQFDVEKARLSLGEVELVGSIEAEKSKLALSDAAQRLREAEAAETAAKVSATSDFSARDRRIEKIKADLARAENAVKSLVAIAPVDGIINVLPNWRSATMMGMPAEYRPGDRTYAGAPILELPDLSSVYLIARLDEADRGRLRNGQTAAIRADAVADREYQATITDISLLARVDFSGGWPPTKQFDMQITLTNPDARLRPGMSALARIAVGQIADVLTVPAKAIFMDGGRPSVYRFTGRKFVAVPIEVIRRDREQTAVKGALQGGDRIALVSPVEAAKGGGK